MNGIFTKKKGMFGRRRFWPPDLKKTKKPFERCVHSQKAFLNSLSTSLHNPVFELFARFETGNAARLDVDLRACLRVAADAAFSFGGIKSAKARQRNLVVATKAFCNIVRRGVENFFR